MYQEHKQKAILKYLKENAYKMCRKPSGNFTCAYVEPGANYINSLWDWDSRFGVEALFDLTEKLKNSSDFDYLATKEMIIECGKGCIINFLDKQLEDGFTPIGVFSGDDWFERIKHAHDSGNVNNQMKPVLAQFIRIVGDYSNDFKFFDLDKVKKYFAYYDEHQLDAWSNLYVWQNDLMVGIDNNPGVFFRPSKSSADIYLNALMVEDLNAFAYVLEKLGDKEAKLYKDKANALKDLINKEMYDERDAFYYTQDVIVDRTVEKTGYHHGFPLENKGLPIKIRSLAGFFPLWAGIPTKEQVEDIVKKNFNDDSILCKAGIRTLAKNEKMFDERESNNPSNWLGPVWTIGNVVVWKALKKYGFDDLAETIRQKTIDLLGDSVINDGGFYESYRGNGEHMLFLGFLSWNCLVSEMLDENIKL